MTSFSDFQKKLHEAIDPAEVEAEMVPQPEQSEEIPSLFASIHHKSDDRPEGYTPDELFWMNHDANAHLPELQKSMRDQRRTDGHDDVPDEDNETKSNDI